MIKVKTTILIALIAFFSVEVFCQTHDATPASGKKELNETIKRHMDYPEYELKNKIEGKVVITFVTDINGEVISYKVTESVNKAIDSTALSIFRKIIWNPAENLGIPVQSVSEFSLNFKANRFNKLAKHRNYKHIPEPLYPTDTSYVIYNTEQLDTIPTAILPDGTNNMFVYIYNNLNYPEAANKLSLTGDVVLNFVVESNGFISNLIPIEVLGGGCTEEAERVVKTITWTPGVKNGKSIRTNYNIKIHFKKAGNKDNYIPNQQGSGI